MAAAASEDKIARIKEILASKSKLSSAELNEIGADFSPDLAGTDLLAELIKLADMEGFVDHVNEIKKFLLPLFAAANFSEVSFESLHFFVTYFAKKFFGKTEVDQLQAIRHFVGAIIITYIDKIAPANLSAMLNWHRSGFINSRADTVIMRFITSRIDPIFQASYFRGSEGTTTTDYEIGAALARRIEYSNPVIEGFAVQAHRKSATFAAKALDAIAGVFAPEMRRHSMDAAEPGADIELCEIASNGGADRFT